MRSRAPLRSHYPLVELAGLNAVDGVKPLSHLPSLVFRDVLGESCCVQLAAGYAQLARESIGRMEQPVGKRNSGLHTCVILKLYHYTSKRPLASHLKVHYCAYSLMKHDTLLLQRLFAAGDAGELDRFRELLHDDVVVHAPFGLSTVGIAAEQESWRKGLNAMTGLRHEFMEVVNDGSMEAARCVVTGTMRGSYGSLSAAGKSFKIDQALFARLRDGKIEEIWEIVDTDSLLRQLDESGESEPAPPSRA